MRRISLIALGSLLALAALGGTVLAKEGAVSKLDALPPGGLHAGQVIAVGYTILMDGVEPYKADTTEIVVRNANGKVLSYPGTPDGAPGHYVAKVYFPAAGTYTWQVTQGSYFRPFDLGTINVLSPVAAADDAATTAPAPAAQPNGLAISLLAALLAIAVALGLARFRMQRTPAAA